MSSQRRDPQPLVHGWELAVIALTTAAVVLAIAALAGVGLASVLSGDGWAWPRDTAAAGRVLAALAHGHPADGLRPTGGGRAPGAALVYAAVAGCELLAVTAVTAGGVLAARHLRPGGPERGMATRREASDALGLRALRDAATIVRPDRYAATACTLGDAPGRPGEGR